MSESASGAQDNHLTEPRAIIAQAVNRSYGYDLFDVGTGDAVLSALARAGYAVTPAQCSGDEHVEPHRGCILR